MSVGRKTVTARTVNLIKQTFRLESSDIELLEHEKARRRARTGRVRGAADLSTLVREAIRKTYGAK
jgi:hypothetical protein